MIAFPLDNTEYEARALGAWCGTRTRGVFSSDGHYAVTTNGDMTITVSPGLAWLKADTYWGVNAFEINPTVLTIDTADGALARIDAVCIRLDKNLNAASLIIKKGAYSPQPPAIAAPIRNLDYDEIYIATIMVRKGATSILASDITDRRTNEIYCGVMRDGVTSIPTQALYDQWMAWRAVTANEFEAWVETLKDILDEEAAGHLQLEIEALNDAVDTKLNTANVVNNLTTTAAGYALDARQGKALNDKWLTENAASATKLATPRIIQTNLASTTVIPFDGSANVEVRAIGILPLSKGGLGGTTADEGRKTLELHNGARTIRASGTVTISVPSGGVGSSVVSYGTLFPGIPNVVVTVQTTRPDLRTASRGTPTQANVPIYAACLDGATATVTVAWEATYTVT